MVIGIQNADVVKMSKAITKAFIIYHSINLRKNAKSSIYYSKSLRLKEYGIRDELGG